LNPGNKIKEEIAREVVMQTAKTLTISLFFATIEGREKYIQ